MYFKTRGEIIKFFSLENNLIKFYCVES